MNIKSPVVEELIYNTANAIYVGVLEKNGTGFIKTKLREMLQNAISTVSPVEGISLSDKIMMATSEHYDVTVKSIKKGSRQAELVAPRHVAIYLHKELTDLTLKRIGEVFGGLDHSTIIHACTRVEEKKDLFTKAIEAIKLRLFQ